MTFQTADLKLHRSSGWLSGKIGSAVIARRTWASPEAQTALKAGTYRLLRSEDGVATRAIIAILRPGERGIIIEGGRGGGAGIRGFVIEGGAPQWTANAIIIEGGRTTGQARGFVIEGGRQRGATRGIIVEGGRTAKETRTIIIEGGLEWLSSLAGGTLQIVN